MISPLQLARDAFERSPDPLSRFVHLITFSETLLVTLGSIAVAAFLEEAQDSAARRNIYDDLARQLLKPSTGTWAAACTFLPQKLRDDSPGPMLERFNEALKAPAVGEAIRGVAAFRNRWGHPINPPAESGDCDRLVAENIPLISVITDAFAEIIDLPLTGNQELTLLSSPPLLLGPFIRRHPDLPASEENILLFRSVESRGMLGYFNRKLGSGVMLPGFLPLTRTIDPEIRTKLSVDVAVAGQKFEIALAIRQRGASVLKNVTARIAKCAFYGDESVHDFGDILPSSKAKKRTIVLLASEPGIFELPNIEIQFLDESGENHNFLKNLGSIRVEEAEPARIEGEWHLEGGSSIPVSMPFRTACVLRNTGNLPFEDHYYLRAPTSLSRIGGDGISGPLRIGPRSERRLKFQWRSVADSPVKLELRHTDGKAASTTINFFFDFRAPLVGREQEVVRVRQLMSELAAGRGNSLVLVGERGIGKTFLFDETLAGADGVMVVRGSEGMEPFDAATRLFAQLMGDNALKNLRPLFEEIRTAVRESLVSSPRNSMIELLRRSARIKPLIFRFEDVHCFDEASLEMFAAMETIVGECGCLIFATARFIPPAWEQNFENRVVLKTISPAEAEEMIRALFPGVVLSAHDGERLYRLAGNGLPLFMVEILRALYREGLIVRSGDAAWRMSLPPDLPRLPNGLEDAITARFEMLPEDQQEALRILVVAGEDISLSLAASVIDERTLDVLETGGWITFDDSDRVRFSQTTAFEALQANCGKIFRRRAARRLADAFLKMGLPSSEWGMKGGEILALAGRTDAATKHYLDLLDVYEAGNHHRQMLKCAEEALRLHPTASPRARCLYCKAKALDIENRGDESLETALEAAALSSELSGSVAVIDASVLAANLHLDRLDFASADGILDRVKAILDDEAAPASASKYCAARSRLLIGAGDLIGGAEMLETALGFARAAGDRVLEARLSMRIGVNDAEAERYEEARRVFSAVVRTAADLRDYELQAQCLTNLGTIHLDLGAEGDDDVRRAEWENAAAGFRSALELAERFSIRVPHARVGLAVIGLAGKDFDLARIHLDHLDADHPGFAPAQLHRGWWLIETGRVREALALLRELNSIRAVSENEGYSLVGKLLFTAARKANGEEVEPPEGVYTGFLRYLRGRFFS